MPDTAEDFRAGLEKQIADLKKEISRMGKTASSRAAGAMEEAEDLYTEGRGRAREVATQMRDQAQVAVGAMRENPGTTATVLTTVGLLGLAAGLVLGGALSRDR
ncbi:hypothetical protein [Pseudogemmobacter faecipullorum]|uniref:DUF883 family protein n=1 Tax=Pseudogemmobacter faecipullorum TaxID=2755041 RepID=A0ABS8CRK0_9RHOB|nr:hypothetical protein [Pseudogemmobacter faecipullorum]MCB5412029.1 hypothetical protein [Pseudogemmobacter faecipullorum]